jgi:hypothetical protein
MNRLRAAAVLSCLLMAGCAAGAVSSLKKEGSVYRVRVPESASTIAFPADGFRVETADDARPYYFLKDEKTGLNVSFNFEPVRKCKTSEECRDYLVAKLRTVSFKKDWSVSKIDQTPVSEHLDGPVEGLNLRQHHLNAHYIIDGVWIDMHLSKVNYRPADHELFASFVRSIRIDQRG